MIAKLIDEKMPVIIFPEIILIAFDSKQSMHFMWLVLFKMIKMTMSDYVKDKFHKY